MNEERIFGDVDLPFHVWVRERSGARGFRWVLREAPQSKQNAQGATASRRDSQPGGPAA